MGQSTMLQYVTTIKTLVDNIAAVGATIDTEDNLLYTPMVCHLSIRRSRPQSTQCYLPSALKICIPSFSTRKSISPPRKQLLHSSTPLSIPPVVVDEAEDASSTMLSEVTALPPPL
ncbi:hypothetical protein KFK09_002862 [Dendrobium nobile]|uniref:Uncharacterized protein n=1 Tax=Dendrobium nobile TaxID=94219 RepID=A0A8T3C8F9_DENNO|nr:hypothetical protein KFK09_002862 [Dendrobium nobile]